MRLVQTLIATAGFRDPAANPERLALVADLVRLSGRVGAHLLVLSAGVLTARSEDELPDRIAEVAELADGAGLAVIGGVDVADGPRKSRRSAKAEPDVEELVRAGRLPFFGFAVGRVTAPAVGGPPWRQTSVTAADSELIEDEAVPAGGRVVTVAGRRVGVLICGELFSRRARAKLGGERPDLIVDVGHSGMGQGLIPAMKNLAAAAGCPVAHAQHLANWWGKGLHFVGAAGERQSQAVGEDAVIEAERLWAAWAVREV
jgi:hypothetical protein